MKLPEHRFRAFLSDHVLFYTYRWGTWIVAALVVMLLPNQLPQNSLFYLTMLLALAGITLLFTTLAQQYTKLVSRYPVVSGIDLLLGLGLVWISGALLPFLPYALGALIPPGYRLIQWFLRKPALTSQQHKHEHLPLTRQDPLSREVNTRSRPHDSLMSKTNERRRDQQIPDTSRTAVETTRQVVSAELRIAAEQGPQALRQMVHARLTPSTNTDLVTALDQIVHSFRRSGDIPISLHKVGPVQHVSPARHLTLIRLAQEALLNVQQHAQATSASLTVCYQPDSITLTVQDDGVGLLDGTYRRPGVHALQAMYYRLCEFDGDLDVFEGDTGGVTVRGILPLT